MTLTVNLKTWFKVIARPLPKGTLWVKYMNQIGPKGENICSWQVISDRQPTDSNHFNGAPAYEVLIIENHKKKYWL